MEQFWSPDPDIRPSFTKVIGRLRSMSSTLQAKERMEAVRHQHRMIMSAAGATSCAAGVLLPREVAAKQLCSPR
ncbi:hypothetical protein E2562_039066 [Oryza meyeriana var. granulata]|uniref:Uncharacterized protein n=1 Tax=Oryza meyeriana var. granulata TaxID=110450 RepID=A0A6G1BR20_9ORYZ|nr:hypothetical protein E2562_039066 [Oryza meyeriana var. granulata]